MRLVLVPLVLAAVLLTGCASTTTSSPKFKGAAADVDKAVGDLQTAGRRKDAAKLCGQLLARSLVKQLDSGGTSCKDEMDKAVADADEFTLDVRTIAVDGSQARVSLRQGDKGATRSVTFLREDNRWKVSSLPAAS
jgi:hypothetical protein